MSDIAEALFFNSLNMLKKLNSDFARLVCGASVPPLCGASGTDSKGTTDVYPCGQDNSHYQYVSHSADLAEAQQWAGHRNIATTRLYDRRKRRPEDSPSYKVSYGVLER